MKTKEILFVALVFGVFSSGSQAQDLSLNEQFLVTVSTEEDLNKLPQSSVDIKDVERTIKALDEVYDLQADLEHSLDDPYLPRTIIYSERSRNLNFLYRIGSETILTFNVDSGALIAISSNFSEELPNLIEPEDATKKLKLLFRKLNWPYQLETKTEDVDDASPNRCYVVLDQVVPDAGFRSGATITLLGSLHDGRPDHIWISYPPQLEKPTGPILTVDQAIGIACGAAMSYLDWPEATAIVNPVSYEIPAYTLYPNALTDRDVQMIKDRKAYLVYSVLVGLPSSWSEEGKKFTKSCVVWVHAESGRVLAVQPFMSQGLSGFEDVPTNRKERFAWEGVWRVQGTNATGTLAGTVVGELGDTKKVLLVKGNSAILAEFDEVNGLVGVRIDGRLHLAKPDIQLLSQLIKAKPIHTVKLRDPQKQ